MKKTLFSLAIIAISFSCKKHERLHNFGCSTSAIVRDLSSQSGCGFVFELADGSKIEAAAPSTSSHACGSHHQIDVLSNFSLADGKKVKIGFELVNATLNSCGVQTARITCIELDNSVAID